jgi:hypothetical protein
MPLKQVLLPTRVKNDPGWDVIGIVFPDAIQMINHVYFTKSAASLGYGYDTEHDPSSKF